MPTRLIASRVARITVALIAILGAGVRCSDDHDAPRANADNPVLAFEAQVGGSSLIAYWPCNGNANDSSPAGNDLVLNGGLNFAPGKFGQALSFTANENAFAARAGDDAEYDFDAGSFTISLWINFYNLQDGQTLIEKRNPETGFGWRLSKFGTTSLQFSASPGFSMTTGTISIPTRVWHHLVMRRNENLIQMFFDGEPSSTISNFAPINNTNAPLLVGKSESATGGRFSPECAAGRHRDLERGADK